MILNVSKTIEESFERFYPVFLKHAQKLNLVKFFTKEELYYKHFFDSLALLEFISFSPKDSIVDVGTGGGFPGIPIALLYPQVPILLIDSTRKKIDAVTHIAEELKLDNVETLVSRAEQCAHQTKYREKFTIVVSRAVADLSTLLEYCAPFVSLNGLFIAYKSSHYEKELESCTQALLELKTIVKDVYLYELPQGYGKRSLIVFEKTEETPQKYPRRIGVPRKKPL